MLVYTYACKGKSLRWKGGRLGLVVMGGASSSKIVSSNPGTIYWMDIFSNTFAVKIVIFV